MSFMRNFSLGEKFALLGFVGVLLFLVPFVFYARQASDLVGTVQEEQAGLLPALQLLRVIRVTQQPGAPGKDADGEFDKFSALVASDIGDGAISARWNELAAEWASLRKLAARADAAAAEVQRRQGALLSREVELLGVVIEHFRLDLDTDPGTHHLLVGSLVYLPHLTEALATARESGVAFLAGGRADPVLLVRSRAATQAAAAFQGHLARSVAKALAGNQALEPALAGTAKSSFEHAARALALADALVRTGASPPDAAEFATAMSRAIDAQFTLAEQAMAQVQRLLDERLASQNAALITALSALAVLFLTVGLFGLGIGSSITRSITEAVEVAERVADGDLSIQVQGGGRSETGKLMTALGGMTHNLRTLVAEVSAGASAVSETSTQIAAGHVDLSQRTEEQASTLEETAGSLEELTTTVTQNAQTANQASQLAVGASHVALEGGQVVTRVVSTMLGISASSRKIADIVGVIDSIAFQTNILALNAAVEAAHAGEQGRGFAVVATEVRMLAQRSAAAAKEIKALIGDSVDQVDAGTRLVDAAGRTMEEIVDSVRQVTELIGQIATASQEQSRGIVQVNTAVTQMDHAVQHNATLVEQAAAATESLQEQAGSLLRLVSRFKLVAEPQRADPAEVAAAAPPPALMPLEPESAAA